MKEVYRLEEMEKIFVRYCPTVNIIHKISGQVSCDLFINADDPFLFSSCRLEMKVTKSSGGVPRLSYTGRDDRHFLPTGLYIIKTVNGNSL